MKTFMASPATIERKWYVVDATGYTLGRLTSEVAKILVRLSKPSPTRGRWHGEAVTDEVEALPSAQLRPPHQSA